MSVQFFLPMIPPTVTAQQHRAAAVGRGRRTVWYDTPALRDAREKFEASLARFAPETPLQGAVRLVTKWCFPLSGSHHHGEYKTTRPDTDNLIKLFKDCMTRTGYWKDDAQVASETTEKFYSETPGIWVFAEEIKNV